MDSSVISDALANVVKMYRQTANMLNLSKRAVSVAFCDRTGSDVFIRDAKKDKKRAGRNILLLQTFFTHKKQLKSQQKQHLIMLFSQ